MDYPHRDKFEKDGADRFDDFLMAHAESLIGGLPFDTTLTGLNTDQTEELHSLMRLANRLSTSLMPIPPDPAFTARLKSELTAPPPPIPSLMVRLKRLPPSYRVAASIGGLTITAGLALLASRRVWDFVNRLQRRDGNEVEVAPSTVS